LESRRTLQFKKLFDQLPAQVQQQARDAYRLWQTNPAHPGLDFKKINQRKWSIYSVRIGIRWRALGVLDEDKVVWFWIGSHAEYDRLLKHL